MQNSHISPLRYPGGKKKLAPFIAKLCVDNKINGHYIEPYAGGASVALFLLMEGFVNKITINDKDKAIYAFWYSVLNETDKLCDRILHEEITIDNWLKQKEVQKDKEHADLFDLGFSTLFLNRTNRSGILQGGVIGGLQQTGDYKIDCRFNRDDIIQRIQNISSKKKSIRLYNLDAIELIDLIEKENNDHNAIFYFDPPYYLKGSMLYMNHYKPIDHLAVSQRIKNIENIKWVVSYDNEIAIKDLYQNHKAKEYSFFHTANQMHKGNEILFFSTQMKVTCKKGDNPIFFKYRKYKSGNKIIYQPPT
jgi:DNA adenine methylase